MQLVAFVLLISSVVHALPTSDPGKISPEDDGRTSVSEEEINQLNKVFDEKLEFLGEAFRNNEMDPLKIKIAFMPENGPVRRWAMDSARHKDEVPSFISDERIAKSLPEAKAWGDEITLQLLDGENINEMVEYSFEAPKEIAASTGKPIASKQQQNISYVYPENPNAELFGLSDIFRNGSVSVSAKGSKTRMIVCPITVGPFKLVMTSPNLEDPLHATHAFSRSVSAELTFKKEKGSMTLTKLRIPRIAAKQTTVFLSKTEKFASRKDELNTARLATHISFELNRLWTKDTALYTQITDAYRNFFNV